MLTGTMANEAVSDHAEPASFERFAGYSAIAVGVVGLVYALAFVVLKQAWLYSLCLLVGGLLTTAVLVAIYNRLRETDRSAAIWGLLLGIAGAVGSALHGAYDLANAINAPATNALGDANLPYQVDPRGLLTFGVAGLGVMVISWLMLRNGFFPRTLAYLGYLLAVLLVVIYLGRLIILDANNPAVLLPAALTGFLINPAWYIWLGMSFLRKRE